MNIISKTELSTTNKNYFNNLTLQFKDNKFELFYQSNNNLFFEKVYRTIGPIFLLLLLIWALGSFYYFDDTNSGILLACLSGIVFISLLFQ